MSNAEEGAHSHGRPGGTWPSGALGLSGKTSPQRSYEETGVTALKVQNPVSCQLKVTEKEDRGPHREWALSGWEQESDCEVELSGSP